MGKEKNVFISHYNQDDEHIQNLKALLARRGYTIKNSSIDSSKPNRIVSEEAIRRLLRLRITWAGTFICLIGKDTHTRPWVDWEIDQAKIKGKFIIGVKVFGQGDAPLPKNFEKYGDCLTGWNSDKIIEALEGNEIGWSDSSGISSSSHSVITVSC
jgi:MTH538 TIR-like domain (DUF1863)